MIDTYFGNNYFYIVVFIISLIYLLLKKPQLIRGREFLFSYTVLVTLFVILNPLLKVILTRFPDINESVLARFWIVCPIWVVIAYSISMCGSELKLRGLRYIFVLVFSVVLIVTGDSLKSLEMTNAPSNIYKIRTESVEIADEIDLLNNGQPADILIFVPSLEHLENYEDGGTIYFGIIQYTSNIRTHRYGYRENVWVDYFTSEITPLGTLSCEYVNSELQRSSPGVFDYIVCPADEGIIPNLEYCGYELESSVSGYYIFSR